MVFYDRLSTTLAPWTVTQSRIYSKYEKQTSEYEKQTSENQREGPGARAQERRHGRAAPLRRYDAGEILPVSAVPGRSRRRRRAEPALQHQLAHRRQPDVSRQDDPDR